jgi:hypothetical protein
MSDTRLRKKSLAPQEVSEKTNRKSKDLFEKNSQLEGENKTLRSENEILRDIILGEAKKNHQSLLSDSTNIQIPKLLKIKKSFYAQIILSIGIIVLALGFHILYLSVTDCLLFTGGDPACFYKSWMGIKIHASLFLDLMLYSIIISVSILIILTIRNVLNRKS